MALLLICPFTNFGWSDSLTIKSVEVVGNYHQKNLLKSLKNRIGTQLDSLGLNSDYRLIQEKYAEAGFFWVEINHQIIKKPSGITLHWKIKENSQATIGKIEIIGNERIATATLWEKLKYRKGTFTPKTVSANSQAILGVYLDSGFPFCQIEPKNFQIEDYKVNYSLKVSEGPRVVIKTVHFKGQKLTKPATLRRIFGLSDDWLYSETKVQTGIKRLTKTNLFTVLKSEIKKPNEDYFLIIEVTEAKSNEIQATFAYLPKTAERTSEYSGFIGLDIKNLFGTMRQIKGNWSHNINRTNYGLTYLEPFLFGFRMNLGGEVTHQTKDTTYAKTNFVLFSDITMSDNFSLRFETGCEIFVFGITNYNRAAIYWVGNGIKFDNRENEINPARGFFVNLINRIGRKTIRYQPLELIAKTYWDGEYILPLLAKANFGCLWHGRNLYSNATVSFYDLFHLGGAQSLRGYPEEAFSSKRIFWLNNELRWRLNNESRIFLFLDTGTYQTENNYPIKVGYGFGLRVGSKIGIFGIDYGIAGGENPLQGKIHLSLSSQF